MDKSGEMWHMYNGHALKRRKDERELNVIEVGDEADGYRTLFDLN